MGKRSSPDSGHLMRTTHLYALCGPGDASSIPYRLALMVSVPSVPLSSPHRNVRGPRNSCVCVRPALDSDHRRRPPASTFGVTQGGRMVAWARLPQRRGVHSHRWRAVFPARAARSQWQTLRLSGVARAFPHWTRGRSAVTRVWFPVPGLCHTVRAELADM